MSEVDLGGEIDAWLFAFLSELSGAELRQLLRRIGKELRASQAHRIKLNLNPDGSKFVPRKRTLRTKTGKIKRRQLMYQRIGNTKNLKLRTTANGIDIYFAGHASFVAKVAQFGWKASVNKLGLKHRYPVRQLLGLSKADKDIISDMILDYMAQ